MLINGSLSENMTYIYFGFNRLKVKVTVDAYKNVNTVFTLLSQFCYNYADCS